MKKVATGNRRGGEQLCLACGLCCNGVIFGDVKLGTEEHAAALLSSGVPLLRDKRRTAVARRWRFLQPCAAFEGCRCQIYPERPKHCRQFECLLLKEYLAGSISSASARQVIRSARTLAQKVDQMLCELADHDSGVPLAQRVRRLTRRLEASPVDARTAGLFSKLSLAFHTLCQQLQERFYPASGHR